MGRLMDELCERVQRVIATHQLLPPRSRVLVAVSGGPDSVALLHLLVALRPRWAWTLRVAHLDHALRDGSREDAEFVRALGLRWALPTTVERRAVRSLCRSRGWSLEDGARRIRMRFLLDVATAHSASHVVVAHTADDQAETVVMRLVRGAGLMGLRAMPWRRPLDEPAMAPSPSSANGRHGGAWLIRPLLEIWRREILAYLGRHRLAYRTDPTNADTRLLRNRIRHELLPLLEREYNPGIKEGLTHLAAQCAWDYAYLEGAAQRQWKRLAKSLGTSEVGLSIAAFRRQPKAMQCHVVREAIHRLRGDARAFEFRHWREVERLFSERPAGTLLDLPDGVQLRRDRERVICRRLAPDG